MGSSDMSTDQSDRSVGASAPKEFCFGAAPFLVRRSLGGCNFEPLLFPTCHHVTCSHADIHTGWLGRFSKACCSDLSLRLALRSGEPIAALRFYNMYCLHQRLAVIFVVVNGAGKGLLQLNGRNCPLDPLISRQREVPLAPAQGESTLLTQLVFQLRTVHDPKGLQWGDYGRNLPMWVLSNAIYFLPVSFRLETQAEGL